MASVGEERGPLASEDEVDSEEEAELEEEHRQAKEVSRGKKKRKAKRKKKGSQFIEEEAMEDTDEDEDADGEGPSKKRSKFIDDMAAIGEDDEDLEDFDMEDPFLMDEQAEVDAVKATNMSKMYRQMDTRDKFQTDADLEKFVQERYMRREEEYQDYDEDAEPQRETGQAEGADQRALQPTLEDPKLWMIKVRRGMEQEIAVKIMQKAIHFEKARRANGGVGPSLFICGVVHHSNLKGYIYIEAKKASHAKQAIKGLNGVYHSQEEQLISLREMPNAMTLADSGQVQCNPGDWVKMRGGDYKGDLARVAWVSDSGDRVKVKLVPRLDYTRYDKGMPKPSNKIRLQARAFDYDEAKSAGFLIESRTSHQGLGEILTCMGKDFVNGYHLKDVSIKSIVHVKPSYDELHKFNSAELKANGRTGAADEYDANEAYEKTLQDARDVENANRKDLTAQKAAEGFSKGDVVIVARGELQNLVGSVDHVSAAEGVVHVKPDHKELTDLLPIDALLLEKYFTVGKHVKVVKGKHEGSTGMVVEVQDTIAVVFADVTQVEMRVFMRDLIDCTEVTHGLTKFGDIYNLLDLVQLVDTESGVIVGVEKEACLVLTTRVINGKPDVRTCRLQDIQRKIYASKLTGFDGWRNVVNSTDVVKVVGGENAGKQGTVKHVAKNNVLFVECRDVLENLGILCVKSKDCNVVGGKRMGDPGAPGDPRRQGREANVSTGVAKSFRQLQRESPLIGKSIVIARGPYKSYRGKVVDANDRNVRVELEAQCKVVTVKHAHLSRNHQTVLRSNYTPAAQGAFSMPATVQGGRGPFSSMAAGARTPMHSGMGAYGSQTPMHAGAYGSQTPMHHSGGAMASPFRISGPSQSHDERRPADRYDQDLLQDVVCQARHAGKYGKVTSVGQDGFVQLLLGTYDPENGFHAGSGMESFSLKELDLVKPVENAFVRILDGEHKQSGAQYSKMVAEMESGGIVRGLGDVADLETIPMPHLAYVDL